MLLFIMKVKNKKVETTCSLLYCKLEDDGIIQLSRSHVPGEQLSVVFDNCAEKNRNRMVLRMGQYLIDTGVFKRVEIIF